MTDITIPPEAVEAAARELADTNGWRNEKGIYACRPVAEAILRAGIAAWPGSEPLRRKNGQGKGVFLPFPKEGTSD